MRLQKRLTQEQLAVKIGISVSFIGHIERGSRTTSLETLVATACSAPANVTGQEVVQLRKQLQGALEIVDRMGGT